MKQQLSYISSLILALTILAVPVNGQSSNSNEGCNFCFRGKPKGTCCSFLIFESGYLRRIADSDVPFRDEGFLFTADLGLMFSNGHKSAIGGSFHLALDDKGTRLGIGPRYRRWLSDKVALDLSPRLLFAGTDDDVTNRFPGFALSASLSVIELLSVDLYFDILPYERQIYNRPPQNTVTVKDTEIGLYLGASGRTWGALFLPVIAIAAAILIDIDNEVYY